MLLGPKKNIFVTGNCCRNIILEIDIFTVINGPKELYFSVTENTTAEERGGGVNLGTGSGQQCVAVVADIYDDSPAGIYIYSMSRNIYIYISTETDSQSERRE